MPPSRRIAAFHGMTTWARTGKRGRPRPPHCAPHPELVYGQVGTQQKQGTLLTRSPRVVRGAERLPPLGLTVRTGRGRTGHPALAAGPGAVGAQHAARLHRP